MWFNRKTQAEPEKPEKPEYWVSPFYVGWHCNGCDIVTNYQTSQGGQPSCCASCGCETFTRVVGRERRIADDWHSKGQWFPRGIDVPLTD